jgi:enoyl-CoA hydratase/carnithine racemase
VQFNSDYEAHAPIFGDPMILAELPTESELPARRPPGSMLVGLDRRGRLPDASEDFDLLLTADLNPPRPWVGLPHGSFDAALTTLRNAVSARPIAASTLTQVLRIGAQLQFNDALAMESFAYSMLLGGKEFRQWREQHPAQGGNEDAGTGATREPGTPSHGPDRIRFTRHEDTVAIQLANPARHNAIDARMRDALCEALSAVFEDPTVRALQITGEGRAFSAGGELEEFGTTPDLSTAHAVRNLRSPASWLHLLREKTTVFVHGACIGSGVEIPAAAGRIVAAPGSWFSLPEVSMGLIPGAGGTVTLRSRIGRHRALYWALANRKLQVATALEWGLVDEIRDPQQ